MRRTIKDLFFLSIPLTESQKRYIDDSRPYLSDNEIYELKHILKTKRARFNYASIGVSESLMNDFTFPNLVVNPKLKEVEVIKRIESLNNRFAEKSKERAYEYFSKNAYDIIHALVSPNLTGFEKVKEAVAIQLFAKEKVHILLLGDPGTGKTDILRSAAELSPVSSFGLGSGTSNAGLSITLKGNEIVKGLIPLSDGGLCAIDELNLIKKEDMASLYSAMEKGFVTYDKADKHIKMDAKINVLATANPKGDQFSGWMIETIKKQLPFDAALLTRFHLIFLIKKPDLKQFREIAKKITQNKKITHSEEDIKFIRNYISHAKKIDVDLPNKLAEEIVTITEQLKKDEKKFLQEINPRLVHGFINLAKASARMSLRKEVTKEDIDRVHDLLRSALYLKKEAE